MESVIRAAAIYLTLLIIVRIYGRRTIGQLTTFDFVLLLIIAEAVQHAMVGEDASATNAALIVLTLFTLDLLLSVLKSKSTRASVWLDGTPLVLVDNGKPVTPVLQSVHLDETDILAAAREHRGLTHLEQIRYAVLEINGAISIIPKETPDKT